MGGHVESKRRSFTVRQENLLALLSDPANAGASDKSLVERAGYRDPKAYSRLKHDLGFMDELHRRRVAANAGSVPVVLNRVEQQALAGDIRSQELFLKVAGALSPSTQIAIGINNGVQARAEYEGMTDEELVHRIMSRASRVAKIATGADVREYQHWVAQMQEFQLDAKLEIVDDGGQDSED